MSFILGGKGMGFKDQDVHGPSGTRASSRIKMVGSNAAASPTTRRWRALEALKQEARMYERLTALSGTAIPQCPQCHCARTSYSLSQGTQGCTSSPW